MIRFFGARWAIFAVAACLRAGTIDVTSQSSQWLDNGHSPEFIFSSRSSANYASGLGISPYPGSIDFTFASLPVNGAGQFTAELESTDGTAAVWFPDALSRSSGYAHPSAYSSPVSAIASSLTLSNTISRAVSSNSEADLVLTYPGSDVDIGIQGDTLPQDRMLSLSGGPMGIGAMVYSVSFADGGDGEGGFVRRKNQQQAVAEPNTGIILLAGGGLCLIAGALKRIPRRRRRDMDRGA
jgi:hypothetical protein